MPVLALLSFALPLHARADEFDAAPADIERPSAMAPSTVGAGETM